MTDAVAAEGPAASRNTYGWYVTAVLMIAYMFSFLDRQIMNLMVGPIRHDLGISDSEFAALVGGAFGLFYATVGVALGWLADHYNRKVIVSLGVGAWSIMTALCGLSGSYARMFAARVGVAVGEATLSPSAYSMLADLFDKRTLPRAMGVYTFGIFLGVGLAYIVGGEVVAALEAVPRITLPLVGTLHSWQAVFLAVGLPGLLVAGWIATLREPQRHGNTQRAPIIELFRFIGRSPAMWVALFLGSAFYSVVSYADNWYPELFIRTWGWDVKLSGRVNGISSIIAGPLGLIFAGWYSSYLMSRGREDACLRLTAYGALAMGVCASVLPLMPTPWAMAAMLLPFKFLAGFPPVLITSAIQIVAPNRLRAQLGAVFLLSVGVIGVSAGPILPALLTDHVFHDDRALKYSLSVATGLVCPIAFGLLWFGMRQYRQRVREALAPEALAPG